MMIEDTHLTRCYLSLTKRQREVLQLASESLTNAEIAHRLYIEPSVVAGHLTNIYEVMGALEELEHVRPKRYHLIRAFAGFFDRHPDFDNFEKVRG